MYGALAHIKSEPAARPLATSWRCPKRLVFWCEIERQVVATAPGPQPPKVALPPAATVMVNRRFPPPWSIEGGAVAGPASTRPAQVAGAPHAFRRRCSFAIVALAPRMAR
jgi:hypothetical protein